MEEAGSHLSQTLCHRRQAGVKGRGNEAGRKEGRRERVETAVLYSKREPATGGLETKQEAEGGRRDPGMRREEDGDHNALFKTSAQHRRAWEKLAQGVPH